jgi:hypothetical protein
MKMTMSNEKIKYIVSTIVKAIVQPDDMAAIEKKLLNKFSGEGYEYEDIRQAFNIVLGLIGERVKSDRLHGTERSIRVLSDRERIRLSEEASSWLLGLYYSGEIELYELEEVLSQVLSVNRSLCLKEIRITARRVLKRNLQRAVVNFN